MVLSHNSLFYQNILYTTLSQLPVQYREEQAGQSSLIYGFFIQIVPAGHPDQVLLLHLAQVRLYPTISVDG